MTFFKIYATCVDVLVLIITGLWMAQCDESDTYVPVFLYGISVVLICLVAGVGLWA